MDFEISSEELNTNVTIQAVCDGILLAKKAASGYGGVAIQECQLADEPITVVYGHLNLASVTTRVGSQLNAGDKLGLLGADKSSETDKERKHLHLGFHRGAAINLLGYINTQAGLADWIDPCLFVCGD